MYINTNSEYNVITGTLSSARSELAATTINNNNIDFAVFAGGSDENGASSTVDIIYINNNTI